MADNKVSSAPFRFPKSPDSLSSPQSDRNRNHTPSVSPLSTASRNNHNRTASQEEFHVAQPLGVGASPQAELAAKDEHDDDRSSSLSEFDGSLDEEQDKMDNLDPPLQPAMNEDDSEAETERLGSTPRKLWMAETTGRTPSKLNQHFSVPDELSEPASSPRAAGDARPSLSPVPMEIGSPSALAGKKRKRTVPASEGDSSLSEASGPDQSQREKRANGHSRTSDHDAELLHQETHKNEGYDEQDEAIAAPDSPSTPEPTPQEQNPYISPMKAARLARANQKAKKLKELEEPRREETEMEEDDALEGEELQDDEEHREKKMRAMKSFTTIAEQFQALRTKLHGERLAAVEIELEQLSHSHPTHPEYLAMLQCVTSRRDTKIQQESRLLQYKIGALKNHTLADRAQLHTQFFQQVREARETFLDHLGKAWYDVQKERRQCQTEQDSERYMYRFPTKRSDQVRQQAKYNSEVSILAGVQKYVGMPAAPEINGARETELDNDLKMMRIPRRQQYNFTQQNSLPSHAPTPGMPTSARTAEQRFLEQTPWANPQHPYHQQSGTPAPFGGYGMHNSAANPPPAFNLLRQESSLGNQNHSPFSTPLTQPQRRAEYQPNGMGSSDTIGIPSDPPSSILAAPPTTDRPNHRLHTDEHSPTDTLRPRPAIPNQATTRDDRRNFSGLSSASTIEVPSDPAEAERPHQYIARPHPAALQHEPSGPHQAFMANAMHPQDRLAEGYDTANFRPRVGAYGAAMPLFAGAAAGGRQEGRFMDREVLTNGRQA